MAGFDPDAALDGLRWQVAAIDPKPFELDRAPNPKLSMSPDSRERLYRLLDELDGRPAATAPFGMLHFNRRTGKLERAADDAVGKGGRAIVFVHGLNGSERTFEAMLPMVAKSKHLQESSVLVYRYPAQSSISLAGAGLAREIKRVCPRSSCLQFVAHSAGGLVVRWYVEKLGGEMDLAITLGTPHAGSGLADMKALADLYRRLRTSAPAESTELSPAVYEGDGQLMRDLEPGSLFLRELGTSQEKAKKIVAVYGRRFGPVPANGTDSKTPSQSGGNDPSGGEAPPRSVAPALLTRLRLPEEISDGDGCVSVRSASLPGAQKTISTRLDHLALKSDPEMIDLVIRLLTR
mgnify:CR=1 FL=1